MLYSNSYLHDIWKYIQNFTWNFKEKLELNFQNTTYCSSLQPIPADTGRKLNVHKTFRRRPGCLLYVLCLRRWLLVVLAKSKKPLRHHSQITWPAAGRSVAWFFCLIWARACIFLLNKILVKTMPSKFHGLCTKN